MSEPLPAPAQLLQGRISGPATVSSDVNGVVHKLLDLADRGNYLEAAAAAADLLQGPANDIRLIAIYLAGLFVERGAPALPELLEWVEKLGKDDSRALTSASEWLFRAVTDRVAFHTTQRDDTWQSWLRDLQPAQVDEIATRCDALLARFPKRGAALQKLGRWAREKLLPAVVRAKRAAPPEFAAPAPTQTEPDPEPAPAPGWDAPDPEPTDEQPDERSDDDESEDESESDDDDSDDSEDKDESDESDDDDEPKERGARSRGPLAEMLDTPALVGLHNKLRAFEIVLAHGELDKAAVIAHDVQAILGNFDPLVYLPALFGRYSELLHEAFPEIEARWSDTNSPQWRILVQFYRTNLAGFVGR